ncbi:MAG: hypothetical protein ACK4OO_03880 [bacterium]
MELRKRGPKTARYRRRLVGGLLYSLSIIWGVTIGCRNPFAPAEGTLSVQMWSDQRTVGGLLHNFALSYDYRDSLRYADCLASGFVFEFYDVERGIFDRWYRSTDLKTTGALFRYWTRVDLEWVMVPEEVSQFSLPDSTLNFIVHFNLTLGNEPPLLGFARFGARMSPDGKFRILTWRDDF